MARGGAPAKKAKVDTCVNLGASEARAEADAAGLNIAFCGVMEVDSITSRPTIKE